MQTPHKKAQPGLGIKQGSQSYGVFPLHDTYSPFLVFHYEKSLWYLPTGPFYSITSVEVPGSRRESSLITASSLLATDGDVLNEAAIFK